MITWTLFKLLNVFTDLKIVFKKAKLISEYLQYIHNIHTITLYYSIRALKTLVIKESVTAGQLTKLHVLALKLKY